MELRGDHHRVIPPRFMTRFKLYIEYEGTRYRGWQVQKNARTVQGDLLHAVQKVFNTPRVDLQGSGRTDAGVHALCQVAHVDLETMLAPEIVRMKINDELPADINILDVEKVSAQFHARHDATARGYLYQISRRRTALGKRYVWWVKDALDIDLMREAARAFSGMHDFRSFTEDDPEEKSTTLKLDRIQLDEQGDLILIRIVGSHFIWKVVRRMVGVLVEVGRRKLTAEDLKRFLHTQSDQPAHFTAPPSGLFLERVYYREDAIASTVTPVINVPTGRLTSPSPHPSSRDRHHHTSKPKHHTKPNR
jgi:tRNA pseudouridine38-40 synthase